MLFRGAVGDIPLETILSRPSLVQAALLLEISSDADFGWCDAEHVRKVAAASQHDLNCKTDKLELAWQCFAAKLYGQSDQS